MKNWHWSDIDSPVGRVGLFARSGEFLTTATICCYAVVLIWAGDTVSRVPSLMWLSHLSGGNDFPWAVLAFTCAVLSPLALFFDDGRLRLVSLFLQGGFLLFLAASAFDNVPYGLLWVSFFIGGLWNIGRAIDLARGRFVTFVAGVKMALRDR